MALLSKPSAFAGSSLYLLVLLLLIVAALVPSTLAEESVKIHDLSKPFPLGNTYNTDAAGFEEYISRDIRRFIVVEDGEIVKEYQRDTVEDESIFDLWSSTKATMSFIIGTIISSDEYDLSIDDTLGDIFTGDNDWNDIVDLDELEFKQNITIFELLTMTSGLIQPNFLTQFFAGNPAQPFDVPNSAGINLRDSLASPAFDPEMKGKFYYLNTSNILSYVILKITGMTPLEYVSVDVFPSIGIDPDKIKWEKNFQGVETSLSSLSMTGRDMAKISQLYLQRGLAAPGKRLLTEEYVNASLTGYSDWGGWDYGYLWSYIEFDKDLFPNTIGNGMWCAIGLFRQNYCLNYESKRVVAYQRSNTLLNRGDNEKALLLLGQAAYSANFTW
eukprot:CAMPEP_0116133780 /NCGR_PEP_ID=MMETSP0329-20121206/10292_1 /TAXON_ID=697910 /ORGANISM="Pseudo-nitzschia arenysensis, Strain B593" /LENGTH=385 /DNA_ID=CAMNT_0003628441 /DNA_START=1249 /DNA_END=2403 /DNA_ORIENTATION=+